VDWENSGWADPAFDIADMLAQPAYFDLSDSHREWIRETYAKMMRDDLAVGRIQIYENLMNVFWLIVLSTRLMNPPKDRLQGVHQYSQEHIAKYQQLYWQHINNFLSL
jgi:thiamine kinase-like enzyme